MKGVRKAGGIISLIGGSFLFIMLFVNSSAAFTSGDSVDLIGWGIILCTAILAGSGAILGFRTVSVSGLVVIAGAFCHRSC